LGRDTLSVLSVWKELTEKGVRVVCRNPNFQNLNESGERDYFSELLLNILSTMSSFEKSMIKSRQMEGIRITQKTNPEKYSGRKQNTKESTLKFLTKHSKVVEYLEKGMNDYITKPYDEEDFFRKIATVLGTASHTLPLKDLANTNLVEKPLYDLTGFEKLSRSNVDFINKMILLFIQLVEDNTIILEEALKTENIGLIKKTMHKIKPNIVQMGIASLQVAIDEIMTFDMNLAMNSKFVLSTQKVILILRMTAESLKNDHLK
jgi:CheY-like chemotaxis protein